MILMQVDTISVSEAIRAVEWALGRINDGKYEGHLVLVEGNQHS